MESGSVAVEVEAAIVVPQSELWLLCDECIEVAADTGGVEESGMDAATEAAVTAAAAALACLRAALRRLWYDLF